MNLKRFTGRTARDALTLVRQEFGEDAVVLSTKPCAEGIEVMAMCPQGVAQIERVSAAAAAAAPPAAPVRQPAAQTQAQPRIDPALMSSGVAEDVEQMSMSTLSFQGYVRERMLKRREAAMRAEATEASERVVGRPAAAAPPAPAQVRHALPVQHALPVHPTHPAPVVHHAAPLHHPPAPQVTDSMLSPLQERLAQRSAPAVAQPARAPARGPASASRANAPAAAARGGAPVPSLADQNVARRDQQDMMNELRQVKGLIEERFGALAFMDKLQRHPAHARLTQKLLDCGFSPMMVRKLAESMAPDVGDEMAWAAGVLERNLLTSERDLPLEDQGGVFALIGSTGVGKTTTTAKIAAAFASKHGAGHLGLVTLDAYRVGAHEQLRAYGRILGVPVHTAHDRASLDDLLDLLSAKKMVLIDTAGMAQRDTRTAELLDMLGHPSINKLLVLNAAAQGETIEDVIVSYRAHLARGVILSKMDEAVKLAPALDAVIRHRLTVQGVANGQRVPEDWHRLPAQVLLHRALRSVAWTAYKLEAPEVNLIFTARQLAGGQAGPAPQAGA
ncbi:MAG: flagellar GTP-binding protein [Methylibium sp. NZG]|nr:MAG: flagellar GTP-binding protein [Methylibium sp. NZG]